MYSITEGFSPILCCRPDIITLGTLLIPEFRITVVVVFLFFFNEEEAIPPGGKKYLGTIKASTRMILVHVQKMYKTCTEDVQYI